MNVIEIKNDILNRLSSLPANVKLNDHLQLSQAELPAVMVDIPQLQSSFEVMNPTVKTENINLNITCIVANSLEAVLKRDELFLAIEDKLYTKSFSDEYEILDQNVVFAGDTTAETSMLYAEISYSLINIKTINNF